MVTGESQQSLSFTFRLGWTTVSDIMSETCIAVFDSLKDTYLRCPEHEQQWEQIANDREWDFPHVIGAVDGNHVKSFFYKFL